MSADAGEDDLGKNGEKSKKKNDRKRAFPPRLGTLACARRSPPVRSWNSFFHFRTIQFGKSNTTFCCRYFILKAPIARRCADSRARFFFCGYYQYDSGNMKPLKKAKRQRNDQFGTKEGKESVLYIMIDAV